MMIRWGVIGAGNIATRFLKTIKNIDDQEVFAISSRNLQKAQSVAAHFNVPHSYDDYNEMLKQDLNFIYIATPHDSHFQIAKEVLEKGVPVLIEKPMTISLAQTKELTDLAKEKGVKVMEALKSLYTPAYRKLKEVLEKEPIGRIIKVETCICNLDERFDSYLYNPACGGSLYDIGVYNVACLVDILGSQYQIKDVKKNERDGVNLYTLALLDFNGVTAIVECGIDRKKASMMKIIGDKGIIEVPLMHRPVEFSVIQDHITRYHQDYEYDDLYSQVIAFTKNYYEDKIMTYSKSLTVAKILEEIRDYPC